MQQFNTEEERKAFELGAKYARAYISFCKENYVRPFFFPESMNFFDSVIDFAEGYEEKYEIDSIPNKENLTFKEFCEKYSVQE